MFCYCARIHFPLVEFRPPTHTPILIYAHTTYKYVCTLTPSYGCVAMIIIPYYDKHVHVHVHMYIVMHVHVRGLLLMLGEHF